MLTRRMQIQAIADVRAGFQIDLDPSTFDQPYLAIFGAVRNAQQLGLDTTSAIMVSLNGCKEANLIIQEILGLQPGNGHWNFKSLADIAKSLKPIEFLWPCWIPRGMLSLLGAVPGAGKSFVALDLCKRIIHGNPWPDGSPQTAIGAPCIYVDAELVPQLTNERASAWEMDTSRLYLQMPRPNDIIDLTREQDRDDLVEMVHALHPALVVIDSLGSISTKGENSIEDVRSILSFLTALANDYNTALVLIHHLRKRNPLAMMDLVSIDDFRGSSHIIAMARSVMALSIIKTGPDPDRNGPRRLEIIKTNLNRYPEPLGVDFLPLEPRGVILDYGSCPQQWHDPSEVERCMTWLLDFLSTGPMSIASLEEERMYSRSTIIRARERLGSKVENTEGRQSPDNKWKLAENNT
jgi:hypothetical protein